eukprot:TRINITY_DN61602_c0_g1_i1.p1 TRINITY_DN61602_c0_g1~~TRINITY_DN61602_c0_g1_i1.p1  ORF type:complete len:534 (+),score=116.98 TRINITY_DN61602_c0_g1_i1:57-1658(+)
MRPPRLHGGISAAVLKTSRSSSPVSSTASLLLPLFGAALLLETSFASRRCRPRMTSQPARDVEGVATASWQGKEAEIRKRLLCWYAQNRRQLPWRGDPPPWSEDKAARKRKADEEEKQRNQPKLSSFFKSLKTSGSREPVKITLDDDSDSSGPSFTSALTPEMQSGGAPGAFERTAYGTWVSEVMLQQTQVERVIAYWTKWMKEFPTLKALAAASADAVNAAWAGLGFYGRARRLHEGAKFVQDKCNGEIPEDLEKLKAIPGVGPYTAGAISSIAFGKCAAVVDGNVIRVFSRLRALPGESNSPALTKTCWSLADDVVDPEQPGSFNQALMELGATVCTPQAPACSRCPLHSLCSVAALAATGKVEVTDFPAKPKKKGPRLRTLALAALQDSRGRWLLMRRPESGLLAGQWELPSIEIGAGEQTAEGAGLPPAAAKQLEALLDSLMPGSSLSLEQCVSPPLEHVFSHEKHTMHVFRAAEQIAPCEVTPGNRTAAWMSREEAEQAGLTSGLRKVFDALTAAEQERSAKKRAHST